jgi:hypothetical protein
MVGKVARVGLIATVLEAAVLLDRGGVGQMDHESGRLRTVDKPVPVVRRFDHDAGQLEYLTVFFERAERHHRIQPSLVTLTRSNHHTGPRHMQFFVAVDQAVVPIETLQFHTRWR